MAARKLEAEDLKHIEELAKGWGKIIVRQQWGEQGPGLDVDLTEMEDVAPWPPCAPLLAGTLEVAGTQRQASQLGSEQACPDCGKMCLLKHEERPDMSCGRAARSSTTEPVAASLPWHVAGIFPLSVSVLKLGTHGYNARRLPEQDRCKRPVR